MANESWRNNTLNIVPKRPTISNEICINPINSLKNEFSDIFLNDENQFLSFKIIIKNERNRRKDKSKMIAFHRDLYIDLSRNFYTSVHLLFYLP